MIKDDLLKLNICIDNEYLDKYVELINSNLNRTKEKYKTQRHHIVPKYYFKTNNITDKNIINSGTNLVNLLYKDHILAHYYLCLCSTDEFIYSNQMAIKFMVDKKICDTSFLDELDNYQLLYEDSKIRFAKLASYTNKGRKHGVEFKEACRQRMLGSHHSEATKHKMSISQKNRDHKISEKGIENISKANSRKHTAQQNEQHSKFMTGRIETAEQKHKISISMSNYYQNNKYIYINKEKLCKRIKENEYDEYKKAGWKRGNGRCKSSKSL